jgi:hypothetical protein
MAALEQQTGGELLATLRNGNRDATVRADQVSAGPNAGRA